MAFDYCTASEAFAYGGSAGASVDPVDEQGLMASIVTGASRAIDTFCRQFFSRETYAQQVYPGKVDREGALVINLPVPLVVSVSALEYRVSGGSWLSADLSATDWTDATQGALLTWWTAGLLAARGRPIQARLSYVAGYADHDSMPADLRWAARAVAWYEYQRRSAPMDKTAMPGMGVVIVPGDWPPHIRNRLAPYARVVGI